MPKAKFEQIYQDLKHRIEAQEYAYQALLPSENKLVEIYSCSRNTVRRAIGVLVDEGCVQSLPGKGVRVIYRPVDQTAFTIGGIETFQESALRNRLKAFTKVVRFEETTVSERLAARSGFSLGSEIYQIERVRYLNQKALIFDRNLFLKTEMPNLTKEIAENSIYDYLENVLNMQIVTSKRKMTVEHATPTDEKFLDLKEYNFLAVMRSQTFNADGVMFEYTESRHRPDYFCFQDTATRKRGVK